MSELQELLMDIFLLFPGISKIPGALDQLHGRSRVCSVGVRWASWEWGWGLKHIEMVSRFNRQCLLAKARQGTKKAKEPDCKVPTETDLGSNVCATPHSML